MLSSAASVYSQSLIPFRYKETTDLHSESLRNSKTLSSVEDLAVSKFIKADFCSVTMVKLRFRALEGCSPCAQLLWSPSQAD